MAGKFELSFQRSGLLFSALIAVSFLTFACGSVAENSNSNNLVNGTSPTSVNAVNTGPAAQASDQDSNANAIDVSNRRAISDDTNTVSSPGTPGGKNLAKPMTLPAPDDSEYFSQLTDVGLEVRTFKKHPQLLKVEKTITPTEQKVKVYLKNGRVIDVPAAKIDSMRNDPASVFLAAAGIGSSASPATAQDRTKQGSKDQ